MGDLLLVYSISVFGLLFLIANTLLFATNREIKKKVSNVFIWYLILLSVIEVCCHIIGVLKPNSNFFISHFYFGFQFIVLSILYYNLIENKLFRKMNIFILVLQTTYLLVTYLTNNDLFWVFNTYEIVSTSIILIAYSLYFIFLNLELKHKYFNFSIGLILYLSCSIAIFLSGNLELVLWEKPYIDIWIFNSLFYIIFQCFVFREYLYFRNKNTETITLNK